MDSENPNDHERAAAGLDFDDDFLRERCASIGASMAENGPEALFEEVENLLPEPLKEQIQHFPIVAVLAGFGLGLFLGMKKGDELLAAGTSMITAAAMANVNKVMQRGQEGE